MAGNPSRWGDCSQPRPNRPCLQALHAAREPEHLLGNGMQKKREQSHVVRSGEWPLSLGDRVCRQGSAMILARRRKDPPCTERRSSRYECVGIARRVEDPREVDRESPIGSAGWYVRRIVLHRSGGKLSSCNEREPIQRTSKHPREEDVQVSRGKRAHLAMRSPPPRWADEGLVTRYHARPERPPTPSRS